MQISFYVVWFWFYLSYRSYVQYLPLKGLEAPPARVLVSVNHPPTPSLGVIMHRSWNAKTFPRDTGTLSRPALRNFKLKCKWILTLTSSIYSPTIYNLNTQWNWFKHNVWREKRVYVSYTFPFTSPTRIHRALNLKWLIMKIQMGFQRPIFASRDLLREPFESLVTVSLPKVRSASCFTAGDEGKGCPPLLWTQDHTIKLLRALGASGWRMVSQASLAKNYTLQQCKIIQS